MLFIKFAVHGNRKYVYNSIFISIIITIIYILRNTYIISISI